MDFRDVYLPQDMDAVKKTEANNDVPGIDRYNIELDFVEQFEDANGILHIRTFFDHDDIAESDLWEVFAPKNGSHSLELLLNNE